LYKVICKAYKKTAERKMMLLKEKEAFGDMSSWHVDDECLQMLKEGLEDVEKELQAYDAYSVDEKVIMEGDYNHVASDVNIPGCLDAEVMRMDWAPIRNMCFTLGHVVSRRVYESEKFSERVNSMFVSAYNRLKDFCEKILQG